jgi:hypothetical protein
MQLSGHTHFLICNTFDIEPVAIVIVQIPSTPADFGNGVNARE